VMNNKKFIGKIDSKDPNLALNFNGEFDFKDKNPKFNLKTNLVTFDLQKLGITKDPIRGSAFIDANFSGNNIDNFTGSARLKNLSVTNTTHSIFLDSANLTSTQNGNQKNITLLSSVADASLIGKFTIAELPAAMQLFLNNYLPNYINKPKTIANQQFSFDVTTKNIEPLIQTFNQNISGCNDAVVSGYLDITQQKLNVNVRTPKFQYQDYQVQNIALQSNGNFDSLITFCTTEKFIIKNEEVFGSSTILSSLSKDTAVVDLKTAGGLYNVKDANLLTKGFAQNNKLYFSILPSSFYFHNSKWNLNTNDYVILEKEKRMINNKLEEKQKITLGKLTLESGLQKIILQTKGDNESNLSAKLENIDAEELSKFGNIKDKISGRLNGEVTINNYLEKPAYSGNISTTEIIYGKDTIGKLFADVFYDNEAKLVTIKPSSGILYKGDKTTLSGTVDVSGKEQILDITANLNNTNLQLAESFLSGFVSKTQGTASGEITIKGPLNNYKLDGEIAIQQLKTKVNYLGTTYSIPTAKIIMNENEIRLGRITMYDELNNAASLTGTVYHNRFANVRFGKRTSNENELIVESRKFLFLNTSVYDNELYYGKVVANGLMRIKGELDNIDMQVDATTLKNTYITLPIRGSFDESEYDFIKFKQYGEEIKTVAQVKDKNRFKITLNINATPDATMRILMDPSTQEDIVGTGSGNIEMSIDLNNDFKMIGQYTIDQGVYGFSFRNVLNIPLIVDKGGTVTWSGDPLGAVLNLNASYKTKASLKPLLDDPASATAEEKAQYPTYAIIKLTGPMLSPEIKYDITQPDNNNQGTPAYNKLKELRANDQNLLLQVFSLIASGQFINTNAAAGTNYATAAAINTATGIVNSTVSNILTQEINKVLRTKNLDINVGYQNTRDGIVNADQFQYNITKGYLDNRITIEVGDNIDYIRSSGTTNFNLLPSNFKLKYLIKPDGRMGISFFSTQFQDIGSTDRNPISGIGLSYRRSINHFKDIWKKNITTNFITAPDTSSVN
jgi:hypothetical protein